MHLGHVDRAWYRIHVNLWQAHLAQWAAHMRMAFAVAGVATSGVAASGVTLSFQKAAHMP
jgi:hypothetical protein